MTIVIRPEMLILPAASLCFVLIFLFRCLIWKALVLLKCYIFEIIMLHACVLVITLSALSINESMQRINYEDQVRSNMTGGWSRIYFDLDNYDPDLRIGLLANNKKYGEMTQKGLELFLEKFPEEEKAEVQKMLQPFVVKKHDHTN